MRVVRLCTGEVLVEDLLPDRAAYLRVRTEVTQLELAKIVAGPRAARASKRRDAAFHAYARAGERGEILLRSG